MDLLPLVILGGLLALDGTAVGQFMVSRPLVAGALAGWLTGAPDLGLAIGAMMELYLLVSFPTGGSRFPEGSTATVVAVAAAASVPTAAPVGQPSLIAVAVALGLIWGHLGGTTVVLQRRVNGRLVARARPTDPLGRRLTRAHGTAIGLDFLRGVLVTGLGIALGRPLIRWVVSFWTVADHVAWGVLLMGAATSLGILLHDLGGFRRRRVLFVAGLALGLVGARFL